MEALDVTDLPKNKVEELKQLIKEWRQEEQATEDGDEDIVFAVHDSNVIGSLTRREIYADEDDE